MDKSDTLKKPWSIGSHPFHSWRSEGKRALVKDVVCRRQTFVFCGWLEDKETCRCHEMLADVISLIADWRTQRQVKNILNRRQMYFSGSRGHKGGHLENIVSLRQTRFFHGGFEDKGTRKEPPWVIGKCVFSLDRSEWERLENLLSCRQMHHLTQKGLEDKGTSESQLKS